MVHELCAGGEPAPRTMCELQVLRTLVRQGTLPPTTWPNSPAHRERSKKMAHRPSSTTAPRQHNFRCGTLARLGPPQTANDPNTCTPALRAPNVQNSAQPDTIRKRPPSPLTPPTRAANQARCGPAARADISHDGAHRARGAPEDEGLRFLRVHALLHGLRGDLAGAKRMRNRNLFGMPHARLDHTPPRPMCHVAARRKLRKRVQNALERIPAQDAQKADYACDAPELDGFTNGRARRRCGAGKLARGKSVSMGITRVAPT